jgi:hypothetical protein
LISAVVSENGRVGAMFGTTSIVKGKEIARPPYGEIAWQHRVLLASDWPDRVDIFVSPSHARVT